ncbi:MAG: 2-keto-myo-inositol isomerase [Acidobacteriota bacterium]|jgi:2-keto-myo-inositol isomerase|nr:2-keto-myo-inositol isomerase [Acidobacteriota bacterium]
MKLALNGATTMKASLAEDIRAASAAGFDCLEIWASKLRTFLTANTLQDLKRLLGEHGIEPYSINSIERITFRDEPTRDSLLAECEELCEIASTINCPYIVVVPGPLPSDKTWADVLTESVSVLNELGQIADRYKVGLAFEFLGQTDCSVQTLEQASKIVERVARENVGLVIDSFHFYAGGSRFESIDALDPQKLFIFHINDAEDLPREQLEDRYRLLPGLGILPLEEIITRLLAIGYDRVTSVEIFRPEYWKRDPVELARAAHEAVVRVLRINRLTKEDTAVAERF